MTTGAKPIQIVADLVVVIIAAAALVIMIADRIPSQAATTDMGTSPPDSWRDEVATGIRLGSPDATLTIVEFVDFQCPFCARWAARVDSVFDEYPTRIQLVMHHYPLSRHTHAVDAAVAVECADRQNHAMAFKRVLFARQEELGTTAWIELARAAMLPNLDAFAECIALPPDSFPRIAYGIALGKSAGVRGTPTVWINGLVKQPSLLELRRLASGSKAQ